VANFVIGNGSLVLETRLNFDRAMVTANARPGEQGDATLSLSESLAFDGDSSPPTLADDVGQPCTWSNNWQLTVLRSATCGKKRKLACRVKKSMWPALQEIALTKDKFSLRGFMAKFAKLCRKHTERYAYTDGVLCRLRRPFLAECLFLI